MKDKEISILGNKFSIYHLLDDKFLLQAGIHSKKDCSTPEIGQAILNQGYEEIINIVASEVDILIYCRDKNKSSLLNKLRNLETKPKKKKSAIIKLDVCFELGMDWEHVSEYLKRDRESIIQQLLTSQYQLINYGFQPGFMYLDGLAEGLHVPRRSQPRLKLPAGSLAIGGKYLGVYGSASPGGWNIIGMTSHQIKADFAIEELPNINQRIKLNRLSKDKYLRKHHHE